MKVFVVEPFGKGGIPQFAHLLSEGLSSNNIDVTLLTGTDYELDLHSRTFEVRKVWKLWERFDVRRARYLSRFSVISKLEKALHGIKIVLLWQREWLKFTYLVAKEKPQIIIVGTVFRYPMVWFYLNIIRFFGVKIAQVCHEFEIREVTQNPFVVFFKRLNDQVYRYFEAIFFLSDNQRQEFLHSFDKVMADRTHVISMGNANVFLKQNGKTQRQMREYYDLDADASVVLLFGRLTADKGISDLIDAFAILVHEHKQSCVLIIAGPPIENTQKWLDQIIALHLQNLVTIDARYIPAADVEPLMQMASVVVYPYWSASQSFSVQVAYSCGRPVIATRVGGLPEDVIDGKSGYVVDPHAPKQLANSIARVIDNPSNAQKMGEYAHHLSITKHSWSSIGKVVADVLRQI